MSTISAIENLLVRYEVHVIALRQEIRHMARGVGLIPCQQARITAAASALARAFLEHDLVGSFWVRPLEGGCRGLEISCGMAGAPQAHIQRGFQVLFDLDQVRLLADEVQLSLPPDPPRLTLRMWV